MTDRKHQPKPAGGLSVVDRLVGPIGKQILALPPEKRLCPNCGEKLTMRPACGKAVVPECDVCGVMFPTGKAGEGVFLVFDAHGNIAKMGLTSVPNG